MMNVTVCQSCGMPLTTPAQFGTETGGNTTREYCIYCYKEGKFEQPDITLEGMIEMCTAILNQEGMDEESARSMLRNQLPFLKRWNASGSERKNVTFGAELSEESADLNQTTRNNTLSIEPIRYVTLPGKRLAGVSARTTNAIEMSGKGCIQGLWNSYFASDYQPTPEAPAMAVTLIIRMA